MRTIALGTKITAPVMGQGTWNMGEQRSRAKEETRALLAGIDAGLTLIDTAEMYGDGNTERFLGAALAGRRDDIILVSKAYPRNASKSRLPAACEASLKRLGTDRLDLYLLHWPGPVPIGETVAVMETLVADGKIRAWGVSNFDVEDLEAMIAAGGDACACNQVLYNVTRRGPEFDLVPWLRRREMTLMAYSPVEQGRLPTSGALQHVATRHGVSPYQVALAFALRDGAIVIPKAASVAHVRDNAAALDLVLDAHDIETLDGGFPPPTRRSRLAML